MTALAAIAAFVAMAAAPAPNAPIPHDPAKLARAYAMTAGDLDAAIDVWRADGVPKTQPPKEVTLESLYAQRIELLLAQRRKLRRATLARLDPKLAHPLRSNLIAKLDLWRITPRSRVRHYKTGHALPPARLLSFYRAAQRRFGVGWQVLAAVNFVESAFNKLRNDSATGAQGPMQFMPATWRAYGLGGNVHDPHDAIIGAANYLHANGAPQNYARALLRYNPSSRYVDAVLRYARQIHNDPRAFYRYYTRQVYVRTAHGLRRITGPKPR